VAGRQVAAELIQHDMTGERIAEEASRLLDDEAARRKMKADLEDVKQKLSSGRDPMGAAVECIERVLFAAGNPERAHAS
jgi:lipid A disaccharide synthetase